MSQPSYLFVAYAEEDYEQVDNIFLEIYKRGIPIRDAKDVSEFETENIVAEARAVLFVITPASIASQRVSYYLKLAEQYDKHIIPYYLCDPNEFYVPRDLLMIMDGAAAIPAYEYATEDSLMERVIFEVRPYFAERFAPKKKKRSPLPLIVATVLICAVLVFSYFVWIVPARQEKAIQRVKNATVEIVSVTLDLSALDDDEKSLIEYGGTGSGFFIDSEGTIATNYHVVSGYDYYLIEPAYNPDDDYYLAYLLDYDEDLDIAILRIDEDYTVKDYLTLSNKKVSTGTQILVAGYPRGIDLTLTNGIVSNDRHYAEDEAGYYYIVTAAVSPGNSGGPVVDKNGRVIGIATAKYGSAENMNLVRPVGYLREMLK